MQYSIYSFIFCLFSCLIQAQNNTPPNFSALRTAAEWEEIEHLVVTWSDYEEVLAEIIRHAKNEVEVLIVCSSPLTVRNYLHNKGIDTTHHLRYVVAPFDWVWVRDYGANSVYANDTDSLIMVDWKYNRPARPNDDIVPRYIGQNKGIPIFETISPNQLIHTGGNFMTDGLHTAFSSKLILQENQNLNSTQINTLMKNFMGIERYIQMNILPYDGIHHIDMHMKLLDEETLLIGEYPLGIADGPQIEANIQYILNTFKNAFGNPYKIIRIPMPPDATGKYPHQNGDYRTYTNAVFVNKTVIVPIYEQKYDSTALRIWREALPGYNIVGVNCDNIIQASGAVHCVTHAVGVKNPLRIVHESLKDTYDSQSNFEVKAIVQHRSGIQTSKLYYKTDIQSNWVSVSMNLTDTSKHIWTGYIPAQAAGTSIYYYIEGIANDGKQQVRPMPAPMGYWKFSVLGTVPTTPTMSASATSAIQVLDPAPNPAKNIAYIPIRNMNTIRGTLSLFDQWGRRVAILQEGEFVSGEHKIFFKIQNYPTGLYRIVLQTDDGRVFQKPLLIQR